MKYFEVKVSGSYKAQDGKIKNYDDVVLEIPVNDKDKAINLAITRYALMSLLDSTKEYIVSLRKVYIDAITEKTKEFSLIGKSIKDLNYKEIQDFASIYGFRSIPLYKADSLRESQVKCIKEYLKAFEGFSKDDIVALDSVQFVDLPNIKVKDLRVEHSKKEEKPSVMDKLKSISDDGEEVTIEELKAQADVLGIKYHPATGAKKLKALIDEKIRG